MKSRRMTIGCWALAIWTVSLPQAALGRPGPGADAVASTKAEVPWSAFQQGGDVLYFAYFDAPARLERYDLASARRLADIDLPESPSAFTVDGDALYFSFGRRTSRFALDGRGEVVLKETPTPVESLFVIGDFLCLGSRFFGSRVRSHYWAVDKRSGDETDFREFDYIIDGVDTAPSLRTVFGRSRGFSPSRVLMMSLNTDGTLTEITENPFLVHFDDAMRVWVMPGEARVADDSGIVYNSGDLTFHDSLGAPFDDLAFYGELPVVARGGEVIAYSRGFLETGRYTPVKAPLKIAVHDDMVFSFTHGPQGVEAEVFPIDLLEPRTPGEPVDPNGLSYDPDAIAVGADNVVYLLDAGNLSIFRWSIPFGRYLETIPLVEAPSHMAYSAETHRLYLTYPDYRVTEIRLADGTPEAPLVHTTREPCGLATAGEYVFVCGGGGVTSHNVYDSDGRLVSFDRGNHFYSLEYVWSKVNRKMYYFRDGVSPNDLNWVDIDDDGVMGTRMESPYHGEIRTIHPIRVSPNGKRVVIGSGEVFDAFSLLRIDELTNPISDVAWISGSLVTMRDFEGGTQFQKWGRDRVVEKTRELPGSPLRLVNVRGALLAITDVRGTPTFSLWDGELEETDQSVVLELAAGRYEATATWEAADGTKGQARAVELTVDTGYFWFFGASNVEVVVKLLDGCSINGATWVFAAGLTNVEVILRVTDTRTGAVREYVNPLGRVFQPIQDTSAFADDCSSAIDESPDRAALRQLANLLRASEKSTLPLAEGRFEVAVRWQDREGTSGVGQAVQLTGNTGYFWFFGPNNIELLVKVLDGCSLNGRYWVFAAGLTSVRVEIDVTDTLTGETRTYVNAQGKAFVPVQDTGAFASCP